MKKELILASLLTLQSSCSILSGSRVVIENISEDTIDDINVEFQGSLNKVNVIKSGKSVSLSGTTKQDGDMILSFSQSGRVHKFPLDYVTPGMGTSCAVKIYNKGFIKVSCH